MKSLRQIEIITKILDAERDKHLAEIGRLNDAITKKIANIQRIQSYQKEYSDSNNLRLSRTVPILSQNLESFTMKIADLIAKEYLEIDKFNQAKERVMKALNVIDGKISVMNNFANRIKNEMETQANKQEQAIIDDLSNNKKIWSEMNE